MFSLKGLWSLQVLPVLRYCVLLPLEPKTEALEGRWPLGTEFISKYTHARTELAENVVSPCKTLKEKRFLLIWISLLLWDHSNNLFSIWVEKSICPSPQPVLIPTSPRKEVDGEGLVGNGSRGQEKHWFFPILQLFSLCMDMNDWFVRHTRGKENQ